jgi:hypothetical protein
VNLWHWCSVGIPKRHPLTCLLGRFRAPVAHAWLACLVGYLQRIVGLCNHWGMNDADESPALILKLPDEIAQALVAQGQVSYYFQSTRDPSLVQTLIIAASSAVVTVAARELATSFIKSLARAILTWREGAKTRDHLETRTATISIEVSTTKKVLLTVEATTGVDELTEALVTALKPIEAGGAAVQVTAMPPSDGKHVTD